MAWNKKSGYSFKSVSSDEDKNRSYYIRKFFDEMIAKMTDDKKAFIVQCKMLERIYKSSEMLTQSYFDKMKKIKQEIDNDKTYSNDKEGLFLKKYEYASMQFAELFTIFSSNLMGEDVGELEESTDKNTEENDVEQNQDQEIKTN